MKIAFKVSSTFDETFKHTFKISLKVDQTTLKLMFQSFIKLCKTSFVKLWRLFQNFNNSLNIQILINVWILNQSLIKLLNDLSKIDKSLKH